MSTAPQIEIGKTPNEHLHVKHMLPLPADTPFGNLSLKYTRIVERLDHVNLAVQKTFANFDAAKGRDFFGDLTEHILLAEEVIYWLRKTADELIGLLNVLAHRESTGSYPSRVDPDSIGALLTGKHVPQALTAHLGFLGTLNDVANAYKHSFVNSDLSLIGRHEPIVFALALKWNNLANPPQFHAVPLRDVVVQFNAFFLSVVGELRRCKLPHRTHA
jgi:hypothetical protein